MDTIVIKDLFGENCITLEDGQKLYDIIHPKLMAQQAVELDFSGVLIFASPFMNAAIGQLLRDIAPDDLNRLLIINRQKITRVGLSILKVVINNAKAYYSDASYREAVEASLRQDLERDE
jgi:hypothetical protein